MSGADDQAYLAGLPESERAALTRINARGLARLRDIVSGGEAIAFLGAAASAPLYPLWDDVIAELVHAAADHLTGAVAAIAREYAATRPDDAVDIIRQNLRRDVYLEVLRDVFRVRHDSVTGRTWTRTQEFVVRCNFRGVVTMSYDSGIVDARANVRRGALPHAASRSDGLELERWRNGDVLRSHDELPVLFAHGIHDEPDQILVATTEYRRAYEGALGRVLGALLLGRQVVWVGFSFLDQRIVAILREIADEAGTRIDLSNLPRQIALMPWDLEPASGAGRPDPKLLRQIGEIQYAADVVLYPSRRGDHSLLAALLEQFTDPRFPPVTHRKPPAHTRLTQSAGLRGTSAGAVTPAAARAVRVFLCHSSADKTAVRALYRRLVDDGFEPWLDEEKLLGGQKWALALRDAVRDSDFVVVCLSKTATTRAGFAQKEIRHALDVADEQPDGTIFVIPVRLEECVVPERLRELHWVDLFAEGGYTRLALGMTITVGGDPRDPVLVEAGGGGAAPESVGDALTGPEDVGLVEAGGGGAAPESVGDALGGPVSPPRAIPTMPLASGRGRAPGRVSATRRRLAVAVGLLARRRAAAGVFAILILAATAASIRWFGTGGRGPGPTPPGVVGSPPAADVTIGTVFPLTGVDRAASLEALAGVRYAIYYINSAHDPGSTLPLKGGLGLTNPTFHGAELRLLLSVDPGDRCRTQAVLKTLLDEHSDIAGLVGARDSTYTIQAIIAADARGVPLVNDSSSAPSLTATSGSQATLCHNPQDAPYGSALIRDPASPPWFFRPVPTDAKAATEFFQLIREAQGIGKIKAVPRVDMLYENNDIFGDEAFHATVHAAQALNGAIKVQGRPYPSAQNLGSSDPCARASELSATVRKLISDKPDIVFAAGYEPDGVAALQTMRKLHYVPPALLAYGGGFEGPAFIHDVATPHPACNLPKTNASGLIVRTPWALDIAHPNSNAMRIAHLFQEHTGKALTPTAAAGFTAMMTLAEAINVAGSTDHTAIRTALSRIMDTGQTIMPWTGINFTDGTGQNSASQFVLQQVVHVDHYVSIYPDAGPGSVATAAAIWPLAAAPQDPISSSLPWWIYVAGVIVIVAAAAGRERHRRNVARP